MFKLQNWIPSHPFVIISTLPLPRNSQTPSPRFCPTAPSQFPIPGHELTTCNSQSSPLPSPFPKVFLLSSHRRSHLSPVTTVSAAVARVCRLSGCLPRGGDSTLTPRRYKQDFLFGRRAVRQAPEPESYGGAAQGLTTDPVQRGLGYVLEVIHRLPRFVRIYGCGREWVQRGFLESNIGSG